MPRHSSYATTDPDGAVDAPTGEVTAPTFERELDLFALTPIYKGSARPDGVDAEYPFRGPALRGQLRAWWRAVVPYKTVEKLHVEELRLFGGVHELGERKSRPRASRVRLGVTDMGGSQVVDRRQLKKLSGGQYAYALWVDRRGEDRVYHVGGKCRLRVSARPLVEDEEVDATYLEPALKALVLLGGSGSRTRRGMGRLWSDELLGDSVDGLDDLLALLRSIAPPREQRDWPSVAGARAAWHATVYGSAGEAVDRALTDFKALRGMESLGGGRFDSRGRLRPAQTDWLRVVEGKPMPDAFTPALGMPLVYRSSNGHLPGKSTTVEPAGKANRLPSPIHIRPVPSRGGFAAVIIGLEPWYRGAIEAKNRSRRAQPGSLRPDAVKLLLEGLADNRDWSIGTVGSTGP